MSHQRGLKRSFSDLAQVANSSKECNNTPYKRRKQTSQALEALGQLIRDSSIDDVDTDKFNKNDILSLTLSRLLRRKYWPSNLPNTNVQMSSGIKSTSIDDDLTGFIIALNSNGRIVLISDNVEYYLRKNVRLLYPQLTSIYDCVSKEDHHAIREILSTPTMDERRAICTWILPRGKRPNRSHTETKSMLLTGHFFFMENDQNEEPLFVARCEQILSSTPNIPSNSVGATSTTTLRFVLNDQLNICEVSSNTEFLLGYKANQLIDYSIHRILPAECLAILEQAKQNCLSGEHCTSMNVIDMYTRTGDRLTFLCNTHMLIEGRRRTMKLGFLAQLIDPALRYDCLKYANKQNIERQKTSVQQKSLFLSNAVLNNSSKTNLAMSPNDQRVINYDMEKVKHQRVNYHYLGNENAVFYDQQHQIIPQSSFENYGQTSSQELGFADDFFTWLDKDKCSFNGDFPIFNDQHDVYGGTNDFNYLASAAQELDLFC